MGCGSSSPVDENKDKQGVQVKDDAGANGNADPAGPEGSSASGKGKSTRARRLSYVKGNANGVPMNEGGEEAPPPNAVNQQDAATKAKNTRGRRLSYVTNDPNAPIPVPAAFDDETLEEVDDTLGQTVPPPVAAPVGEPAPGGALRINVACMSRAGKEPGFKKTNQDNCFAFEKYITEDQSLFGALDGHGPHGHLVSGYVKQHLPIILVNHLTTEKDVKKALSAGFIEVNNSLSNSRIDCEFSGSTAVVSFLKGKRLTTAWVGDSRGVLGRETPENGLEAVDLTDDHKPTNPEEKARILRSNGRVERLVDEMGQPMGPYRVWLQYAWIPGLAMSRALGDVLSHQVGVSSEPDHRVIDLDPSYKFMILASDGVWEFISSKEAVEIVAQYESVEDSCRMLVEEAYQRWLTEEEGVVDDITAVVVRFIY